MVMIIMKVEARVMNGAQASTIINGARALTYVQASVKVVK